MPGTMLRTLAARLQNLTTMLRTLMDGSGSGQAGSHRLRWWICFSGVLHAALILILLAAPPSTARRDFAVPVYTVDLVAGDGSAPSEPEDARKPEPPRKQEAQEPVSEPASPEPRETAKAPREVPPPPKVEAQEKEPAPEKKVAKPEKEVAKPEKVAKPKKVVKPKKVAKPRKLAEPRKVAKRKAAKPRKEKAVAQKKAAKPKKVVKAKKAVKPKKVAKAKKVAKPKRSRGGDSELVRRLKQRRMEAVVATARERARMRRAAGGVRGGSGAGAGTGNGNGGGGVVRGMEFVAYFNQMLGRIKEFWTWPHRRGDLEVTVVFGVRADGEVFGLELLKRSGNASFDESVVRAVRRASPLPPPPRSHAREFAQVEVTFRPEDLDGQASSG